MGWRPPRLQAWLNARVAEAEVARLQRAAVQARKRHLALEGTEEEGSGSGLPPQWTDGGNGDVTARTDDASTPFTIEIPTGATEPGLELHPTADQWHAAIRVNAGVIGDLQGNSYILRVLRDNSGGGADQTFDLDAWGSALIREAPDGGAGSASWTWYALDNTQVLKIDTALKAVILNRLRVTGVTPPADGDLSPSQFEVWFDDTDGSAAPQWKGKSADGTVVSGSLGGIPLPRIAAGVPSGAPTIGENGMAIDTTAVTGGIYGWNGSAWIKGSSI